MSATGTWNIITKTPMGNQESRLELKVEGSSLNGALIDKGGERIELSDGAADGNRLQWKAKVSKPLPMNLQFIATVEGDNIKGDAKSPFGAAPFAGTRG